MTVHNYRSRQVYETLNGVNQSSGFRDMRSAKSGSNLWQIWQVFGPWASPYGANGQMSMTVHNYRHRQFHRTSNGENPSSGYRDMGSASLAAARPTARSPVRPPARPPARTVTTIPLQPGGLRGKKEALFFLYMLPAALALMLKDKYVSKEMNGSMNNKERLAIEKETGSLVQKAIWKYSNCHDINQNGFGPF